MTKKVSYKLMSTLAVLALAGAVTLQAAQAKKAVPAKKVPAAKKSQALSKCVKPFNKTLSLSGVLVARDAHVIKADYKALPAVKVEKAVEFGTRVKKGDVLVWLDNSELAKKLAKRTRAYEVAMISAKIQKMSQKHKEAGFALSKTKLENDRKRIEEDYNYFQTVGYKKIVDSYAARLRSAKFRLQYAKSEYDQLKKMYDQDQLREETESVILLRQKLNYESAKRTYERAARDIELDKKYKLPGVKAKAERDYKGKLLSNTSSMMKLEAAMLEEVGKLDEINKKIKKIDEDFANYKADLESAKKNIIAPADGIVYYGDATNKIANYSRTKGMFTKGAEVKKGTVLMTILAPGKLEVPFNAKLSQIKEIKIGQVGTAVCAEYKHIKLTAKVVELSSIMTSPGQFAGKIEITCDAGPILPGMKAKIDIVTRDIKKAVLVPTRFVKADPKTPADFYLNIRKAGKVVKTPVKLGLYNGNEVEITSKLDLTGELVD